MQLYGIADWLEDIQQTARDVVDAVGNAAQAKINQWRADYAKFQAAYKQLLATPTGAYAVDPARRSELISIAQDIQAKANWIESQLTSITGFAGLSGYRNHLGILPLLAVPAVIITAMIAATVVIYQFTDKVSDYLAEQRYVDAARDEGKSAADAIAEAQRRTQSGGLFGDASQLVWPIGLALIGFALIKGGR